MEDVLRSILHFYVMSSEKPKVLLTNDDGIESGFLRCLIDAFITDFEVLVCAPDGERSWIGHAISRNAKLKPKQRNDFPCKAYELNGTPADCVNLAIGNLLPEAPDVVVSGINLGYNITLPMILSSGTVGAALEGALLGHHAVAASMALPNEQFEHIRKTGGNELIKETKDSLQASANTTARYAKQIARIPHSRELVVHNLNFPIGYDGKIDPVLSFAGNLRLGSLFEKAPNQKHHQLVYRTEWLEQENVEVGSDLWTLNEGLPSVSRLDFGMMSGKSYLEP